jgi:hypothetical protein
MRRGERRQDGLNFANVTSHLFRTHINFDLQEVSSLLVSVLSMHACQEQSKFEA